MMKIVGAAFQPFQDAEHRASVYLSEKLSCGTAEVIRLQYIQYTVTQPNYWHQITRAIAPLIGFLYRAPRPRA
jgi:hypothetical protein